MFQPDMAAFREVYYNRNITEVFGLVRGYTVIF